MSFEIMNTREADMPGLQRILSETGLFPPEFLPDMLQKSMSSGHIWLTACAAGEPVAFCYARPEDMTDGTWNVLALAVLPSAQGSGIGRNLMTQLEHQLANTGQRLVLVDTSSGPEYVGARGFYRAIGYRMVAEIPDFWAKGDAKATFAKSLL